MVSEIIEITVSSSLISLAGSCDDISLIIINEIDFIDIAFL